MPITRTAAAAVLLLSGVAASAPAGAEEQTILPGYWSVTNRVAIVAGKTEKRCITPPEVAKFVLGPSNRHYKCDYPTKIFKDGKITLKGVCATKNGHTARVDATGAYTPTTFKMTAKVRTSVSGLPVSATAVTDARRLSETCPTEPVPS
jgi:hypothetical protein